ncbi:DUF3306 domain-containing protein [Undibacterium arcticum]|uniref:DUF3306 domain-containing protein n=1 Tax=Undibacterium arcticum TaxID=1762892 RepID=A0ABV7F6H5_9BURK
MAAEHFFTRWAKPKPPLPDGGDLAASNPIPRPTASTAEPTAPGARALPTLDDVAGLHQDSDFSPFLAQGVDETVKRSALKKLFTNPHFNVMDGLDTYIDDYGKADPMPPGMLAALNHAKALLDPLAQLTAPLSQLTSLLPAPASVSAGAAVAADASGAEPADTPTPSEPDTSSITASDDPPPSTFPATSNHAEIKPKGAA